MVDKGTCPQCKADILKSLGLGEAIQQPSPIAETTLTENDEENPLETPPSGDAADADAESASGPSGQTESLDGDASESNIENNRETTSEPGDINLTRPGQNNQAFEPEESVVTIDETNAVNVKRKNSNFYYTNFMAFKISQMRIFRKQKRRSSF